MFDLITLLVGGLVIGLGLFSKRLEQSPLPPTLLALVYGIVVGPAVLGLVQPAALAERPLLLERIARLTLGVGLISVALRIPKDYIREHGAEMARLVVLAMVLMWGISTGLVLLILGLPLWYAAVIGAILTPTDPIAATPIVTGPVARRNVPERLRNAVSFESGANDGLAYPFVMLAFMLLTRRTEPTLTGWLARTLLWEVGFATAFGVGLGYLAARLLRSAQARGMVQEDWRLVYTAALALVAVGAGRLLRSDEILLAFAAGSAFVQVISADDRRQEELGQEAFNRFFSYPIYALIGASIPWDGWRQLGWRGLVLAAGILLLRRPPVLLLLRPLLPSLRRRADALFMGWFGPVAVAATYYAGLMERRLFDPLIWHVVSLVICASAVAHGLTSTPLSRLYGRQAAK